MARLLMDTTLGDPGYGKRSPTLVDFNRFRLVVDL